MNVFTRLKQMFMTLARKLGFKPQIPVVAYAVCVHEGQVLLIRQGDSLHLPFHTIHPQQASISYIQEQLRRYLEQRFPGHIWHVRDELCRLNLWSRKHKDQEVLMEGEPSDAECRVYGVGIGVREGFLDMLLQHRGLFVSDTQTCSDITQRTGLILASIRYFDAVAGQDAHASGGPPQHRHRPFLELPMKHQIRR